MEKTFDQQNTERIKAVDESFRPSMKSLFKEGRVLVGEGRLLKQCRRKTQPKVFFLFNDVIVYGSILLHGRWYKDQKIIPLESIKLEDMEDTARLKNQWLIRTPRKSFVVAAASKEDKHSWMQNIELCKSILVKQGHCPSEEFAVSWMPDKASQICLICKAKFKTFKRRHHCRKCGILVCHQCSKDKTLLGHISTTEKQKVCRNCYKKTVEVDGNWENSTKENRADSSDEENQEGDDSLLYLTPSTWVDLSMGTWSGGEHYMSMHPAIN
ncbi:unnamed protein product [Knipowitschia caucasica]